MLHYFLHSTELISEWLVRIIGHEGGYTNAADDEGNWTRGQIGIGKLNGTKWGIAAHSHPDLDIVNLTKEQAADIYIKEYLLPLEADNYTDGVAFQLLDYCVNSGFGGIKGCIKRLQKLAGLKPDGIVGPATLAKIGEYSESDLIMLIVSDRLEYMTTCKTWSTHGAGWVHRMAKNLRYGVIDS